MTKGDIDRLGEKIGSSKKVSSEDLDMLQEYRQTFQLPISHVFNFVLGTARKIDRSCIVTYRIKRIDTIVEKLHRFHENPNGSMKLSRMWDIAGCRCIFNSEDGAKLYRLLDEVKKEYGADCKLKDYVAEPKSSGYRSIHIYVKERETQKPIEIQIRNKEQHNWATLVEIVDLLYGTQNKERSTNSRLGRFLCLYSKAAEIDEQAFAEMLKIEREMKVFEKMSKVLTGNYLNIRKQWLKQKQKGNYFVITANKKGSEIISFPTFAKAEVAYYEKYLANSESNIVLTHLKTPDFEQISMAYSNYVLAMHAFFDDYRVLISKKIIQCVRDKAYLKFVRYFKIYNSNVRSHVENLSFEMKAIKACKSDSGIPTYQIYKWRNELQNRLKRWLDETNGFVAILGRETRGRFFVRWLAASSVKRMAKAVEEGQKPLRAR